MVSFVVALAIILMILGSVVTVLGTVRLNCTLSRIGVGIVVFTPMVVILLYFANIKSML